LDKHESLLKELWELLSIAMGSEEEMAIGITYETISETWTLFGFQQKDPVSDIRGGGVLCVQLLIYFLREHKTEAGRMLRKQQTGSRESIALNGVSKSYPFAAGIAYKFSM